MAGEVSVLRLGRTKYRDALELQRRMHRLRAEGRIGDLLLITEHDHVLTLGRNADESHLRVDESHLHALGIELIRTERGGNITYHGPGQMVCYAILDLQSLGLGIRRYMELLEQTGIDLLTGYGATAGRKAGFPGVWVGEQKIASIGAFLARRVTMHGIAINIDADLSYFDLVDPCGVPGLQMTSLARLVGQVPSAEELTEAYEGHLGRIFGLRVRRDRGLLETAGAPNPTPSAALRLD
jgi:lipoate-protein ligase B